MTPVATDKTAATRQAKARARGRQLRAILRDPAAIARLMQLIELHGSERAAIEAVLSVDAVLRE